MRTRRNSPSSGSLTCHPRTTVASTIRKRTEIAGFSRRSCSRPPRLSDLSSAASSARRPGRTAAQASPAPNVSHSRATSDLKAVERDTRPRCSAHDRPPGPRAPLTDPPFVERRSGSDTDDDDGAGMAWVGRKRSLREASASTAAASSLSCRECLVAVLGGGERRAG